jgi:WhiB family transcriptional regulator, redox-sensing transcriptional regulator
MTPATAALADPTPFRTRRPPSTIRGFSRPDWFAEALCLGRFDWFFPSEREGSSSREYREHQARRLCARCPVLDECRAFAREHGEHGFWGGETEHERAAAGYPPRRHRLRIDVMLALAHRDDAAGEAVAD